MTLADYDRLSFMATDEPRARVNPSDRRKWLVVAALVSLLSIAALVALYVTASGDQNDMPGMKMGAPVPSTVLG